MQLAVVLLNNTTYCAKDCVTLKIDKTTPNIIIIFIRIWLKSQKDLNCDFQRVIGKKILRRTKKNFNIHYSGLRKKIKYGTYYTPKYQVCKYTLTQKYSQQSIRRQSHVHVIDTNIIIFYHIIPLKNNQSNKGTTAVQIMNE